MTTSVAPAPTEAFRWERDMTPLVEACAERFAGSTEGHDAVLAEVPAAVGVVDLLVVRFDREAIDCRAGAGVGPICSAKKIHVLDAVGTARWRRVDTIAREVGSNGPALMRSTLLPLAEMELLELDGGRMRATGVWSPVATHVTAIELKLEKWRSALRQADNFALSSDRTWVVIDSAKASGAKAHVERFRSVGIGLAAIDSIGDVRVLARPSGKRRPAVRWLRSLMAERALAAHGWPAYA
jgi:hypothetical protein